MKEHLKKNKRAEERDIPWLIACYGGFIAMLAFIGFLVYSNFAIPQKDATESDTNVDNKADTDKEMLLIGDADGYPLKLKLSIINEEVTGIYINVTYGTTMIVKGNMVNDIIDLKGSADQTIYTFHIVPKGDAYTGTFARLGSKGMKLYLRKTECEHEFQMTNHEKETMLIKKYLENPLIKDDFEKSCVRCTIPSLIPTPSNKWIYGYFEEIGTDNSVISKVIISYDVILDSLKFLLPKGNTYTPYGETDFFCSGYKDYKLVGNHLYLIHQDIGSLRTPYSPHSIYYIDVDNNIWYTVGEECCYGEKTEFVDDKIKAQIYYVIKESEDLFESDEYSDYIKWIKME